MDTSILQFHRHARHLSWVVVGIVAFGIGVGMAFLLWTRSSRIVRGVSVAGLSVSGLTQEEATKKVSQSLPILEPHTITLTYDDHSFATSAATLGFHRNLDAAITEAIQLGRRSTVVAQQSLERAQLLAIPRDIPVTLGLEEPLVRSWVTQVAQEMNLAGREPKATLTNKGFTIDSGELGQRLVEEILVNDLLTHPDQTTFDMPIEITIVPLSADGRILAEKRLETLRSTQIVLTVSETEPTIILDASDFFPWIKLPFGWKPETIDSYIDTLAEKLNRDAVNAEFERGSDDLKLKKFQPQIEGREVQRDQLHSSLLTALMKLEEGKDKEAQVAVPFRTIAPQVKLEDLNALGIKERLGQGNSTFYHSIPNRVSNVELTSHRMHAVLVAPGEEFSFSQALGEVNQKTGFKPAYVISGGRTILGDGGGVCQVSTTTFRAALNAGLPITRWKPHSYRVGYYEQNSQPGFDATVYGPTVDLRFLNDTGHYLALATIVDADERQLAIEIWGTSDGRQAEISNYQLSNQTGAPAAAYIPDPTLPKGVTRQVDWSAPGATARFTYTVVDKNGQQMLQREFVSRFQAWRAVFLVGTQ